MRLRSVAPAAILVLGAATGWGETTRTLRVELAPGSRGFTVENLAGTMEVVPGDGNVVEAVAVVHAGDAELAATMRFEKVRGEGGEPALRVVYPLERHDRIRYAGGGDSTVTYDGYRVKVSRRGGVELWAEVTVRVPRSEIDATFRNLVGSLSARDLKGHILLDAASATIQAQGLEGDITADTGSGDVQAERMRGSFTCDTGSGGCTVAGFDGDTLTCDTGSGRVKARDVRGQRVRADTGSGAVRIEGLDAEELSADTGSGEVDIEVSGARLRRVWADTGSGRVSLRLPADASFRLRADVGSGRISCRFPDARMISSDDEVTGCERGDGRIRIDVNTGSGGVVVQPR